MTTYLSCADTAKLVRQAIKEAFPGVKFSVRSKTYTGGASVRVTWGDGPTVPMVESIARRFEGSTFDPMTDSTSYRHHEFQGECVSFGPDFVFCDRTASVELTQKALDRVWDRWRPIGVKPAVKLTPYGAELDSDRYESNGRAYLSTLLYRERRTMAVGEYPGTSALADQVKTIRKGA